MRVPNYIRAKMHLVAKYSQKIGELEADIENWLDNHGFENSAERFRDDSGYGLDELSYGVDITDDLCKRFEQEAEKWNLTKQ